MLPTSQVNRMKSRAISIWPGLCLPSHPSPPTLYLTYNNNTLCFGDAELLHPMLSSLCVFVCCVPSAWTILSLLIRGTLMVGSMISNQDVTLVNKPYWFIPLGSNLCEVQGRVMCLRSLCLCSGTWETLSTG